MEELLESDGPLKAVWVGRVQIKWTGPFGNRGELNEPYPKFQFAFLISSSDILVSWFHDNKCLVIT